jgi:hypothetical protein
MPTVPSWDLIITLFFIITIAYGFILQRDKAVITLISVYVALIIVQVLSGPLQDFFAGDKTIFGQLFIKSTASPFTIQVVLFASVIALVSMKSGLSSKSEGSISPLEVFGFSVLNAALIISSIFYFMPEATRMHYAEISKLANFVINYHTWWLVLPVILLIVTGWKRVD